MPDLNCKNCKKEFHVKPSHLKNGWGLFCSNKCSFESRRNGKFVDCETCLKKVYRTPKDLNHSKSKKYFCSKSCFAVWKNKNMFFGEKSGRWKNGKGSYRLIMVRSKAPVICRDCGIKNMRVLVTHRIDGNRKNNKINNLTWLCRNCHYLIHEGKTF